jgi:AraC-like DNA-binding protein
VSYREHAPPPALAPWVECAWERRGEEGVAVRVVPDGCIDVIWTEGAGTTVVGANTTAFLVTLPGGVRVAGVRMLPGAAPGLLGADAAALRDARVPAHEVLGDPGRRLAAALDEAEDHVQALLAALAERARAAAPPDPLVRAAVARLRDPEVGVAALARELHVSERQLRRRVVRAVGYGPKRLARVLRLREALAAARAGDEFGRVAADAGYADQAHFASDCHELAGAPPSRLLAA